MRTTLALAAICALLSGCGSSDALKVGGGPKTESAADHAGWKEISASGISLKVPADWKTLELGQGEMDEALDRAFGGDPNMADLRTQAREAARSGAIKLMAFEPEVVAGFRNNVNVVVQEMPGKPTARQIADAGAQQMAPAVADGTKPEVKDVTLPAGQFATLRSEIKLGGGQTIVSMGYITMVKETMVMVTFSSAKVDADRIAKVAEETMQSMRLQG